MGGRARLGRAAALLLIVLARAPGPAGAQAGIPSSPRELVLLIDRSQSVLPWFDEAVEYVLGPLVSERLRLGDRVHLLSFGAEPRLELAETLKDERSVRAFLARLYLLAPLDSSSDLAAAFEYLDAYAAALPAEAASARAAVVLTDGVDNPGTAASGAALPSRARIESAAARLAARGWELRIVKLPFSARAAASERGSQAASAPDAGQARALPSPSSAGVASSPAIGAPGAAGAPPPNSAIPVTNALRTTPSSVATPAASPDKGLADGGRPPLPASARAPGPNAVPPAVPASSTSPSAASASAAAAGGTTAAVPAASPAEAQGGFGSGTGETSESRAARGDAKPNQAAPLLAAPNEARSSGAAPIQSSPGAAGAIGAEPSLATPSMAAPSEEEAASLLDSAARSAGGKVDEYRPEATQSAPASTPSTKDAGRAIGPRSEPLRRLLSARGLGLAAMALGLLAGLALAAVLVLRRAKRRGRERASRALLREDAPSQESGAARSRAAASPSLRQDRAATVAPQAEPPAPGAPRAMRASPFAEKAPLPEPRPASRSAAYRPSAAEGESLLVELRVAEQNPAIGSRNVHLMAPGSSRAVGGGRSDFLVFLVPVPRRAALLHLDGGRLVLEPLLPSLFPGAEGPIVDCLDRDIAMVSPRGYPLTLRFARHVPPAESINRLLHCIEVPGPFDWKA